MPAKTRRCAQVDMNICVACGCCEKICPLNAISIYRGIYATIDVDKCVGCGKCARECPAGIITVAEVRK